MEQFGKIEIGDHTSIGVNCMILPRITIGKNYIGEGCFVGIKSVLYGCMATGNPARFIGYPDDVYKNIKSKKIYMHANAS